MDDAHRHLRGVGRRDVGEAVRNPNCTLCPLHQTAKTVCVWGREHALDSARPRAMAVGEAPGRQEDEQGTPFVGMSGQLLDEVFVEAKIVNAYLTNVVKCFPDGTPDRAHVKACADYLDQEITQVKPVAILALGATAWHRLGGKGAITENEGKEVWSGKYNCWIVPARHPAALLRAMGGVSSWKAVIHRYARLLEGRTHTHPPAKVYVVETPGQLTILAAMLKGAKQIVFDFETTMQPFTSKDFKPLSVAFSIEPGSAYSVPLKHVESPFALHPFDDPTSAVSTVDRFFLNIRDVMTSPDIPKTAHNSVFDAPVWRATTGYMPYITCDTLALAHLLDENRPKGLKWLGRALLGWPNWDIDARKEHPLRELLRYNGYDTVATLELREKLLSDLESDIWLKAYFIRVLMPGLRAIHALMVRGIPIDQDLLFNRIIEAQDKRDAAKALIPVENPGSTVQVVEWLYKQNGLPITKTTPKGKPSTDEETINRLARKFPEAKGLLAYRKWQKVISTYLLPIGEHTNDAPVGQQLLVYQSLKIGPETGRFASRMHTIPRDPFVRSLYGTGDPDTVLVSADYRQIEARLVAWAAAGKPQMWKELDPNRGHLLDAFHKGVDPYIVMAASFLHKSTDDVTPRERQDLGKVPTLACLYRISPRGLQEYAWKEAELDWDFKTADALWKSFYKLWPEIRTWQEQSAYAVSVKGWVRSDIGRMRRIPEAMRGGKEAHEAANSAINHPIQSLASDITLVAASTIHEVTNTRLCGFVHDSLLALARNDPDNILGVSATLAWHMQQAPKLLQPLGLCLPDDLLKVEVHVGPWGSKTTPGQYVQWLSAPVA